MNFSERIRFVNKSFSSSSIAFVLLFIFYGSSVWVSCFDAQAKEILRINQLQVIGSHNSYKQAIQPELLQYAISQDSQVEGLAYSHLPIDEQLDLGLRKLELDIYHDPDGGRYAQPLGNVLLSQYKVSPRLFDEQGDLSESGFKVFHVQDIDFRSHCLLLTKCLATIRSWSELHPDHIPIVITINVKTDPLEDPSSVQPLPFTSEVYVSLDKVIRQGLGDTHIITPTDIQGEAINLREGVLKNGWPSLQESKQKFIIVLDEPIDKINTYLGDSYPDDKIMFTNVPPDHDAAAFIISNDPIKDELKIRNLVAKGYMVRTRADADTKEARRLDYTRFEAAKRSGAQYISTDYYYKSKEHPDFIIQFENKKYVRCNPVLNQGLCDTDVFK